VVIGGQAVNIWAERYARNEAFWNDRQPYTSADLDVLGSQLDVIACSKELDGQALFPEPGQNTPSAGKVIARMGEDNLEIDFVHSPNGLSEPEVREFARVVSFEDTHVRVLHPLHCVESKTVNLMRLPQEGHRQDLKHLELSVRCLREFLASAATETGYEQGLVRIAQRLRGNANSQLGLEAARTHGVNFQEAVPVEVWRSRRGPLAAFITEEWEPWKIEVEARLTDLDELSRWLKSIGASKEPQGR
jgi:hypothetical protein